MRRIIVFILFAFATINKTAAQENRPTEKFKEETIAKIGDLINDNYVFPDVAKTTAAHLEKKFQEGRFNADTSFAAFAKSLTEEVQSINHDKHMRVRAGLPNRPSGSANSNDGGFKEVKMLEGNIGYIDMRLFLPAGVAASFADEHMKTLSSAKAIIIDLRSNGGGSPDMVQYLCSYFFDKKIHLNSIYSRLTNSTREFWTTDVKGEKRPTVPLYVLTSSRTFSGAEEFSYNMQTQKRATLIGETTGGGANPGGYFPINKELSIFIPTGKAINPVTGTNWEGIGVKPDIIVPVNDALNKAIDLAKKAIK